MSTYRIKEVDATHGDIADTLRELNGTQPQWPKLSNPELDGEDCYWWMAFLDKDVVGFAGIVPSLYTPCSGYFKRVLVLPGHQGHGLQMRFMRTLERKAKAIGWEQIVSETTDTIYSANNFIRCGYHIYDPKPRWAFQNSIYWRKYL
jgi:GNAT superfamily N-acetyltransferase